MGRSIAAMGRLVRQEKGQDLIEYGLLMMLIAVGAVIGITSLGDAIHPMCARCMVSPLIFLIASRVPRGALVFKGAATSATSST